MRNDPLAEVQGVGLFGREKKDAAGSLLEEQREVDEDVPTQEGRNGGEGFALNCGARGENAQGEIVGVLPEDNGGRRIGGRGGTADAGTLRPGQKARRIDAQPGGVRRGEDRAIRSGIHEEVDIVGDSLGRKHKMGPNEGPKPSLSAEEVPTDHWDVLRIRTGSFSVRYWQ